MITLVYGKCGRKRNAAIRTVLVYTPERKHYYNAMRLFDAIMSNNRTKKGMVENHRGRQTFTPSNGSHPYTIRTRPF